MIIYSYGENRSFECKKIHAICRIKNQHDLGEKWAQDAPFASIFQKFSRGRPPDPHLQEGVSPSRTLPLRRFAPIWLRPPRQWTLWVSHCSVFVPYFSSFRRSGDVIHFKFPNLTGFKSATLVPQERNNIYYTI